MVKIMNMIFLVFPGVAVAYTFLLLKFTYFSYPLTNPEADQMHRFQ